MAHRLIDTDILIDALRGYRGAHVALGRMVVEGEVATSVVNLFELECGAESNEQRRAIRELLQEIAVSVLDADDVIEAAKIDRELRAIGQRLETRDTLIAGVARSRDLALVTRNRRHFDRVTGLRLESPD